MATIDSHAIRVNRFLLILVCLGMALPAAAQRYRADPVSGAGTWETDDHGVHFSLTRILPDQARTFYVNRGFTLDQIEPYAASCVFMTVLRNDRAPGVIHFKRSDWRISVEGKERPLKPASAWLSGFAAAGVGKPARIAFQWAQFPVEQEYEPGGDWNQGMLSVGLPAGNVFDIRARWGIDGRTYEQVLKGVRCEK